MSSLIAALSIQTVLLAVAIGAAVATFAKKMALTLVAAVGCGIVVSLFGMVAISQGWVIGSRDVDFATMFLPVLLTVFSALITKLLIVLVGSGRS